LELGVEMKHLIRAAVAVSCVLGGAMQAEASSVLPPGITVGLPVGMPLPEGVYLTDTTGFGHRSGTVGDNGFTLPVLTWATPFKFYDTRLQLVFAQPVVWTTGTATNVAYANSTLFAGQLAHDFGHGFGMSYMAGYRAAMSYHKAFTSDSYEQRLAVSYTADGYDLTANLINGIFGDRAAYPDWLNLDLTATKQFGKFEAGVIAYGSSDLSSPTLTYKRLRQFAVGGLVGYNFGLLKLQAFVSRDVAEHNYGGYDTRGWLRLSLPLPNYQAQTAAITALPTKY
jgi:hypothetical protein